MQGKWLSISLTITSVWAGSILMARSLTEVKYLWPFRSNLDSHNVVACSQTVNVSCKLLLVIALLRSSSCSPSRAGNMVVHISFAAHVGWCNNFFFVAVTRIEAHNEQMYMQLDVATEIYPMRVGDKFNMVLAPTLNLDGTPDTGYYTQVIQRT